LFTSSINHSRATPAALAAMLVLGLANVAPAHPEIDDALARVNAALAAAPDNAALYLARGELYFRHEDWVMAEANYIRAGELDPAQPGLARAQGALEFARGQPRLARDFFDRAIASDPRDAEALIRRARARVALGQRALALADFDAGLDLIAQPPPPLFLERAALLPPVDALRSLDTAIARIGPVLTLQLRAIEIEESLGRIDAAAQRLALVASHGDRPEMWLKRSGDLYQRAGRTAEAQKAYAAALAAIAQLPRWLRESPETARLAAELFQLTGAHT
jgi:tetratricopeptide (TPR) repeat protein